MGDGGAALAAATPPILLSRFFLFPFFQRLLFSKVTQGDTSAFNDKLTTTLAHIQLQKFPLHFQWESPTLPKKSTYIIF